MENKMTQRNALVIAIELVENSTVENKAEVLEKLNKMVATLDKKKSGGKASEEKAKANKELLDKVLAAMSSTPTKATEIATKVGISTSKFVALVKPCIADGSVINSKDGKTSLYNLA